MALARPGTRPAGSGSSDPAPPDPDRGAQEWSQSALRSGGAPAGTPPAGSGRSGSQGRITRLAARCSAGLSPPGRDGFLGEPDGQASPLAQGGVVLGLIFHPVPLLGDAVTASGIDLEWHGRIRNQEGSVLLCHPASPTKSHPCNKAAYRCDPRRTRDGVGIREGELFLRARLVCVCATTVVPGSRQEIPGKASHTECEA